MGDGVTQVVDVPAEHRYEIRVDGETQGFAAYLRDEDVVTFTHTEVHPTRQQRGLGGALVEAALDDVRAKGLRVRPLCSFVRHWMDQHPDYESLRTGG